MKGVEELLRSFNRLVFASAALLGSLLAFQVGFAGETPASGEAVPADKVADYCAVAEAIAAHPEMSREDMEALLREHALSAEESEKTDQPMQGGLGKARPAEDMRQELRDVRTKPKETTP